MKTKQQTKITGIVLSLALILYASRWAIFKESFFPFILWNTLLALIPLGISRLISPKSSKIQRYSLGALWLLFFPNSFYMATDLIHLRESTPSSYWIDLVVLLSFSFAGFIMGFSSFQNVEKVFNRNSSPIRLIAFRVGLFAACSYGLFMGRIQRWNSWDLFVRPDELVLSTLETFRSMSFTSTSFTITLSFFIFLFLIYQFIFVNQFNEKVV